jgi:hypothetical protein
VERHLGLGPPPECILAEEVRQRCRNRPVVLNKAAVVPCQAEERADNMHCSQRRPVQHHLDLSLVHGHAGGRNDMDEVGDLLAVERALRLLDEETVFLQGGEDSADVE